MKQAINESLEIPVDVEGAAFLPPSRGKLTPFIHLLSFIHLIKERRLSKATVLRTSFYSSFLAFQTFPLHFYLLKFEKP
jgi:hypothetical protein